MRNYRPLKKSKKNRSQLRQYIAVTERDTDLPPWRRAKKAEAKANAAARAELQEKLRVADNEKALGNRL